MNREVVVRAPGKVNLQLAVGPVQEDGYHPLATVFQAVDLYEVVTARARADEVITLAVAAAPGSGIDVTGVPVDHTNLAWRAAVAVAEEFGIADGVDLSIMKAVPVAGGMAGGSADAAAALVACAEAWDTGATRSQLLALAASLGADVPFALHGHTAVGLGRGDRLSPAMTHGTFHWVFATQAEGLSTKAVYDQFDEWVANGEITPREPRISDAVMQALISGDAESLGAALTNDLQLAAEFLNPRLDELVRAAYDMDACGAIVSGSGPTVAVLARSNQHALALAAHLRSAGLAHQVVTAQGPAAGATVLA